MTSTFTYNPGVFNVGSFAEARGIILTPEGESGTDERWISETPYLADLFCEHAPLNEQSLVLDYGCGIGRLAKELIRKTGCRVVGVDISPSMRAFAAHYVNSPKFVACAPDMLDLFPAFDAALSVWVLQHCLQPETDTALMVAKLKQDAPLFVVNNSHRALPVMQGNERAWAEDGKDVLAILSAQVRMDVNGNLDPAIVPDVLARNAYWAVFRK